MPTLYRNGRVYSRSGGGAPDPSALLVDDGVITWIGQEDGAAQHASVEVVDLEGGFVAPAFVDAHVHATGTGLALSGLDLASAPTLAAALDQIERAARASRGRPLLGGGWDETRWPEQRPPTAQELDRAAYGGSVYLTRVDAHSAVVSSVLASSVAGLADMPGARGNGWVTGAAHDAVRVAALNALTPGHTRDLQRTALQHAAAHGIACVHEMAGPAISSEADLASLLELARSEPLPEVIGYWGELLGIGTARELGAVGAAGDLFCDGSLGSHTAALTSDYADEPGHRGELKYAVGDLAEHIRRCVEAGLQAGFHVIGDAAVDQVLAAFEAATDRLGRPAGIGSRLEHVEMVSDPARLAASGLVASMQPAFDAAWGGHGGMYAARLGEARAGAMNRFAELAAAGVPLAFGSDSPVTPIDPWAGVRAAAYPHEPGAAISVRAAFTAHTRAGWRAAGRDNEGVLAPGMPATFAVWRAGELGIEAPDDRVARWSTDPRSALPGLPDLRSGSALPSCVRTVRNGRTIFELEQS